MPSWIGGVKPCWPFLGFWRLKSREPCFRIREVAKSETLNRQKVPLETSLLLNVSGFKILVFLKTRSWGSLFWNSQSRETRYRCGGGCGERFQRFGILGFDGIRSQKLQQRKSWYREIWSPELVKGMNLLWSRRFGLVLLTYRCSSQLKVLVQTPKRSSLGPHRIDLNIPLILIDSLIPPQGISHTPTTYP
jgi:hypothetical protein